MVCDASPLRAGGSVSAGRERLEGRVAVETARELLDFQGSGTSPISEHAAEEQLKGAVALHNILRDEGFAYLADEVGMGKTYVALGAVALFRHFNPGFRVLVIAPRENIQKKWVKEIKNFSARNVRFADLRVKAVHGAPAQPTVLCHSLAELVRETTVDPDRDFYARLTSFSLPLGKDTQGWAAKRNQLRRHLPWLDPALFDLRNKETFKDNFARAVNCGLPTFDLVIFDEGHNLKGGLKADGASRNRILALAFGHPTQQGQSREAFPGYGRRARRVLFLSATPLENDYVQLWNQLDIFGFGSKAAVLRDPKASDEEKRSCARRFLIRRVTSLPVGGSELTKNLYRREWRQGGVVVHDDPLTIPDEKQRLTVALVQKKVSEVLGQTKFNNCFQIGMLASFESFLETAGVRVNSQDAAPADPANFDDPDQTENLEERAGIDVGSVNHLARSYRRHFGSELPHPKMDSMVAQLARVFTSGDKALVFVRRVASVTELQRKLEEQYDNYLFARLHSELPPMTHPVLDRVIGTYREERFHESKQRNARSAAQDEPDDEESIVEPTMVDDAGGLDSFFAWFFRGEGPEGILSGATLQRRFSQAGSVYSTFFEDNHVAWLLGVRPILGELHVAKALAAYLGRSIEELGAELSQLAAERLPRVKRQQRRNLFFAFQEAALALLTESPGSLRDRARAVREERYSIGDLTRRGAVEPPPMDDWLEATTLWTEMRERSSLRLSLWPESSSSDFRAAFREQELRRELFSAMARLGHPFIDLYVLSVNRIGRLELRAREQVDEAGQDLVTEFLDRLEVQSAFEEDTYTSYRELKDAAANFDLILAVNEPAVRTEPLSKVATLFGRLLRAQQPVGGMFGQVNETLVRQFRMPGYPLVLITTDLLQEGEDLHTFCSSVYHYGISWMPSSMEQRVGRVDRVSSQTDRRLTKRDTSPEGHHLLQVYYPHLRDTVEVLQVDRVLERLNRFIRLMHEDIGGAGGEDRSLNVGKEILRRQRDLKPLSGRLRTAFPIRDEFLRAPRRNLAVTRATSSALLGRFSELLPKAFAEDGAVTWEPQPVGNALMGTIHLRKRVQPFTLMLRSVEGRPAIRCVSPVGVLSLDLTEDDIRQAADGAGVRIGAVYDERIQSYNLTVEGDILLGSPEADVYRVRWLLGRVTEVADRLEQSLLGTDEPMATFRNDLEFEITYER
jgi:hypothetical protein